MTLVALHDGRQVDSCGREWQIETLARWALSKPLEERRALLAGFEKRSPRTAEELRGVMTALHKQRQAA